MISDEQSKAVEEVAKTTGKFVEISEKVGGFVSKVIGGASNQVGGILEDWTRYYRYKNLLCIADKVEAIHAKRKILGKSIEIPPRIAIPMLESASLENNETLQEVWARLIANSTDPNFKEVTHPGFIEVIKQLSSDEAIILKFLLKKTAYPKLFYGSDLYALYLKTEFAWNQHMYKKSKMEKSFFEFIFPLFEDYCRNLGLKNKNSLSIYFDNLIRLRILEIGHIFSEASNKRKVENIDMAGKNEAFVEITEHERDELLKITTFGQSFIAACIADNDYHP